jgi:hypothetical protein
VTSIYLKCDGLGCAEVVDRRPKPDDEHGGTFHWSQAHALREYAKSQGWLIQHTPHPLYHNDGVTKEFCPRCSVEEQLAQDRDRQS